MSDEVPILGAEEHDGQDAPPQQVLVDQGAGNDEPQVPASLAHLVSTPAPPFKRVKTFRWAILGICACSVMIMLVFILPVVCNKPPNPNPSPSPGPEEDHAHHQGYWDEGGPSAQDWVCTLEPLSLMLYTHVAHWVVHLIVDQVLKTKHKKSRVSGYIQFYLDTKNTRRTPFYLVSVGNALLLVTITALHDYCDPNNCEDKYTKVDYLRGLITLECLIIISLWTYYCRTVKTFNQTAPVPDCMHKDRLIEMMVEEPTEESRAEAEARQAATLRPMEPPSDEAILERQAEMIRYLQTHGERQSKKLLELHRRARAAEARVNSIEGV